MIIGDVEVEVLAEGVVAGIVLARGCVTEPASPELEAEVAAAVERCRAGGEGEGAHDVAAVRDLLRFGKYKPTGRGKPASEYLARAAIEGRFPRINNLVDINNLVSLTSRLPVSLIDLARAGSSHLRVRRGRAGESYVFNSAGQVIELEDLLLVAHLPADTPCANPVKDSMATKLEATSSDVVAVLYAPPTLQAEVARAVAAFAGYLERFGRARSVAQGVVGRLTNAG